LELKNILGANRGTSYIVTYYFKKDYTRWKNIAKRGTSANRGTGVVPKEAPTIDNRNLTKEIEITSNWYLSLNTDFPDIDIDNELRRFEIWLKDNPRADLKRAFRNWLLNCKPEKEGKNIEHDL